jgi:exodeoxyribonuclease V beta subunit
MSAIPPVWRQLPLHGTSMIEASAGTGKTWNIALLYLRLVLERKLGVRQILVTTFTDAAAQELRARIRARLLDAERIVAGNQDSGTDIDAFLAECCEVEGRGMLRARLQLALADIDMAPISTIHGFCRRVLSDYPFDTGVPFVLGEIVDESTLIRECVEDFWRARFLGNGVDPSELDAIAEGTLSLDKLNRITAYAQASPEARMEVAADEDLGVPGWLRLPETIASIRAIAEDKSRYKPRASALAKRLSQLADDLTRLPAHEDCLPFDDFEGLFQYLTGAQVAAQEHPERPGVLSADPLLRQIRRWAGLQQRAASARLGKIAVEVIEKTRKVLPERLRLGAQTTFSQLIAEVHDRLTGSNGAALSARLRQAWPVALIDEFQDTDARQWAIFERIYQPADVAADAALILIGDPKQSIYAFRGADIHAYLTARQRLRVERLYSIRDNFRSHPRLLEALNGLYRLAGDQGFAGSDIRYVPVRSGRPQAFNVSGRQQALRLRLLQCERKVVSERDRIALAACANDIVALLADTSAGITPGDIAVLIDSNQRVQWMRDLLVERGVPVVGAGRASVLATEWAADLQLLLFALLQPNDEYAARGALATRLLGATARELSELGASAHDWERKLERFAGWRRLWDRRGVLAVVEAVILEQAPRLLACADGERALTDLRHLGEVLQDAAADCYGPDELYARFVGERNSASAQSIEAGREQQLRIESEARRVQLLTIHSSKGLEYPVVFIPTAWRKRSDHPNDVRKYLARYHDGKHRLCLDVGTADFDANKQREQVESLQERLRVLYVAMTRAKSQCIVYAFDDSAARSAAETIADVDPGALDVLLGAALHAAGAGAQDHASRWDALDNALPSLQIDRSGGDFQKYRPSVDGNGERIARAPLPSARPYHGLYSFTGLTRAGAASAVDAPQWAEDEAIVADNGLAPMAATDLPDARIGVLARLKGPRFGDAVHQLLEEGRAADSLAPAQRARYALQSERIAAALDRQSMKLETGRETEQLAAVAELLDRTLDSELAPGLRLASLPATACRPEFEFAFGIDAARWHRLHRLLDAHGLGEWWPASAERRVLRGMMRGFIDLVFAWDGRFHVLDYKTNWLGEGRLSDYATESLDVAMREHHYGLQALIYTVALHRYLGHRLVDYDPDVHLGESWYLFVRGVGLGPGAGIWRQCFPQSLVAQLDALFAGEEICA